MKQETNHSPVERVVDYIKTQIAEKQVNPGDRLPSERKLSELLKVGRPHIRAALQKLETYGVVETRPQSGTTLPSFLKAKSTIYSTKRSKLTNTTSTVSYTCAYY